MVRQSSQTRVKPKGLKRKKTEKLNGGQRFLLRVLSCALRLWTRTLRFRLDPELLNLIESTPPSVAVLWHNRLFAIPEFYRRYVHKRKLAAIVSASGAGAWLSGLFEELGIKPIRGSRYRRSLQAFREMLKANKAGYDVGITPDGSRGPMYDMKAGPATLACRTNAPILLLSCNFQRAFRLNTWDRFYIPLPFSYVDVKIDVIEEGSLHPKKDAKEHAVLLEARLNAITDDNLNRNDDSGVVV